MGPRNSKALFYALYLKGFMGRVWTTATEIITAQEMGSMRRD